MNVSYLELSYPIHAACIGYDGIIYFKLVSRLIKMSLKCPKSIKTDFGVCHPILAWLNLVRQ